MNLTKKEKDIIRQDIIDLKYLVNMYTKENKLEKANNCLIEMKELEQKLK